MAELVLAFLPVCVATAYVCTAVKEDDGPRVARGTLRFATMLFLGIAAFGAAIFVGARLLAPAVH